MRRYLAKTLIVLALLLASAAWGQGLFAARISMCGGLEGGHFQPPSFCGLNATVEDSGYGVFVQTLPRFGPFWDNWEVYGYRPEGYLGGLVTTWPGVAVGREEGEWFVRLQADVIFVVRW